MDHPRAGTILLFNGLTTYRPAGKLLQPESMTDRSFASESHQWRVTLSAHDKVVAELVRFGSNFLAFSTSMEDEMVKAERVKCRARYVSFASHCWLPDKSKHRRRIYMKKTKRLIRLLTV
ncbi:MAG: hypothetical protein ACREDR_18820, partial [Blastocatellia bacterium]